MRLLSHLSAMLVVVMGIGLTLSKVCVASQFVALVGSPNSPAAVSFSEASAVGASGTAVAGTLVVAGNSRAFLWTASEGLKVLEDTRKGLGLSADGLVVVGDAVNGATGFIEPFRWTTGEGLGLLGGLAGGTPSVGGFAYSASHDGAVVVGSTGVGPATKGFTWSQLGAFNLLNPNGAPLAPNLQDVALDVSDDGSVVVGRISAPGEDLAVRWSTQGGMQILGNGYAAGVSGDGTVVVGSAGIGSFRWTA